MGEKQRHDSHHFVALGNEDGAQFPNGPADTKEMGRRGQQHCDEQPCHTLTCSVFPLPGGEGNVSCLPDFHLTLLVG